MVIAAFLPKTSINELGRLLPAHHLREASSWLDLELIIREGVHIAVFDPSAGGRCNTAEATKLLARHPSVTLLAYVTETPENLKSVFNLSKYGLEHVFVFSSPTSDIRLLNAVERGAGNRLASGMLAAIDGKLVQLPSRTAQAVNDLFKRPYRYTVGLDLAREAQVPPKQLYRQLLTAGLRSPKQLLTFARALQTYGYLRSSKSPVRRLYKKLGYSRPDHLSDQIAMVFGCSVAQLRNPDNQDEMILRLLEWLHKPRTLCLQEQRKRRREYLKRGEMRNDARNSNDSALAYRAGRANSKELC